MAGYKNKIKWGNRICSFEREGVGESDMIKRVTAALGIDPKEIRIAMQKDRQEWEAWADKPIQMQMIVRLFGAVSYVHKMPSEVSSSRVLALKYAQNYASSNQLRVCLVLSRRESAWISANGDIRLSKTEPGVPNFPYASVGGKKFLLDLKDGNLEPTVLKN